MVRAPAPWMSLLALCACTQPVPGIVAPTDDPDPPDDVDTDEAPDTGTAVDDTADTDAPPDPGACRSTPRRDAATRAVVVARPYTADGQKASRWEVMELDAAGELSRPGTMFTLGRGPWGRVAFSPDGSLGVVAQEDGSLGIFLLDDALEPTVVEAAWTGPGGRDFYASDVVLDATGSGGWVIDGNWPENGGAIYAVSFDCVTGAPTLGDALVPSKLAAAVFPMADGRATVVARKVGGRPEADVFLLDGLAPGPTVSPGARLFDYDGAILGGSALMSDERFVLVGDNSAFGDAPNRVGWASVDGAAPVAGSGSLDLGDPFAIVASPFGDAAVVASGFGDALFGVAYDPDAATPFQSQGELDYTGAGPALPSTMVVLTRGALKGLVLVSENTAIRQVRFEGGGVITDLGPFSLGDGIEDIPGAIGVQP